MTPASLRRLFTWCVALLPVLVFGAVLVLYRVPAEVRDRSVQLTGEFKKSSDDNPAFAREEVDDSTWETIQLPMFVLPKFAGGEPSKVWARRRFTLPADLAGQPLYFMAGGFWPGTEVYLNGHRIGAQDLYTRGLKPEAFGIQGWEVPAGLVREGENVLALRMTSLLLWESRLILGAAEPLRSYFLLNSDFKRLILNGELLLLAFFAALVAVFWTQEENREEKSRYGITLHIMIASVVYTAINTGVLQVRELTPLNELLQWLCIIYFTASITEWIEWYVLRKKGRARVVFRAFYVVAAVLLTVLYVARKYEAMNQAWGPIASVLLVPLGWGTVNAVRGSIAQWKGLGPVLLFGVALFMVSTLLDILPVLQVPLFPRLSTIATSNLGVVTGVLIVGDFLRISYENKDLTASLGERNAELAVALAKANEAVRLKGEFVANISHELRTPLNAIVNVPEGLLEAFSKQVVATCSGCGCSFELSPGETVDATTACPECRQEGKLAPAEHWALQQDASEMIRHLELLNRSGRNLLHLVDNVLDFSRLDAGKMTLALEEVTAHMAVTRAVEGLRPLAQQRSIELSVDPVDPSWRLRADPVKLTQVLVNLMGNAIKFSPEGTSVAVGVKRDEGNDGYVFSVRDQGPGIPPGAQELIFESFRQVDGSHTRRFGGTGLGLSIAKQLVELHGGSIWVTSAGEGQGSTFSFRIPRTGPPKPSEAARQIRSILVVDDDPVAIEHTRLALRPLGHQVLGLTDPRRLNEAVAHEQPNLILMDAVMGRASALLLLQALRGSEHGRTVPVIVTSELHGQKDAFLAYGASWLARPCTAEQMREEVRRRLLSCDSPLLASAPPREQRPDPA